MFSTTVFSQRPSVITRPPLIVLSIRFYFNLRRRYEYRNFYKNDFTSGDNDGIIRMGAPSAER